MHDYRHAGTLLAVCGIVAAMFGLMVEWPTGLTNENIPPPQKTGQWDKKTIELNCDVSQNHCATPN
ncbi:hypothetical protein ABK905_14010 [Acerihabitans sp. KWT182]|uniref:Uncharacterized protein n=1 Tax=Acerihabitans sp. KWT182 TaxID=3157919 RepID=A0AAU7Q4S7_9GAMM